MNRSQPPHPEHRTVTPDGLDLQALYTESSATAVAQRTSAGWRTLALVDPRRGPVDRAVDRARRFGADGVWLRPSESMEVDEVVAVARSLGDLGLTCATGAVDGVAAAALAGDPEIESVVDLGWDPLSAAMQADDWSPEAEAGYDTAAELLEGATRAERPRRVLACSSLALHAAGGDPVDELALLAAGWLELWRRLREAGQRPTVIAERTVFEIGVGGHLLTEIAKLRAAREVLARLLVSEGVDADPARQLILQAVTSPRTLAATGHRNNALRATGQATAAILGGTDRLVVLPWDDRLLEVTPGSDRLALQLQNVLRHEARLAELTDPGAGSFAVDGVTDQLGRQAWRLLHEVEAEGGAWLSLRDGLMRRRVGLARHRRGKGLDDSAQQVVGVNVYPDPHPAPAVRNRDLAGDAYAPFFDDRATDEATRRTQ